MGRLAIDLTGQRFGRLAVLSRHPENHRSLQAQWVCSCDCGATTVVMGYGLRSGSTRSCGCLNKEQIKSVQPRGAEAARREASEMGYGGAHDRVRATRGSAKNYTCSDCVRPAQEWSLRHDAPVVVAGLSGGFICYFSGDPDDYEPRCASCHRKYDAIQESA